MSISSPSALIIRLDAIGDALALTPLLQAFRERGIPVDVVLRAANFDVFSSRAVREVHVAPFELRSSTPENLAAITEYGSALRDRAYSHVLVATEDPGGYRLARAIGSPHRIGFHNGWGKPLKTLWVRSLLTQSVSRSAGLDRTAPHEAEVLFSLGRSLLAGSAPSRDAALLRPLVIERESAANDSVAVQITDKWERLGIAFDDVVELVRLLSAKRSVRAIASRHESAYATRMQAALGTSVELFDTLDPWKSAIASARALVAPDSGALHVAGMTGTPTVGVFPSTPEFTLQRARWYPWAAAHEIVRADEGWPARSVAAIGALI